MFNEFLFSLDDFGKVSLPYLSTLIFFGPLTIFFQILLVGVALLRKAPILTQFLVKPTKFALVRRSSVMYLHFPNFVLFLNQQ